tara:strand:+ start:1757 stop:1975 length:219 start_codon:yes stop_codon:yes gene_type:complete
MMLFEEGQLVRMIYMQEVDPDCELGIVTVANKKQIIIHWFTQGITHKLTPASFREAIARGVYEIIGIKNGKS